MKVILNKDLSTLGEEGDVKEVARGYARNYLFPRGIAFPHTPQFIKLFGARKAEIEARKAEKRKDSASLKERLENLELSFALPAGPNGRLYGAVTGQTIQDELSKQGFQIDRKRVELSSQTIKSVGKYKAVIKLYENSYAEISVIISALEVKTESKSPARQARRKDQGEAVSNVSVDSEAAEAVVSKEESSSSEEVASPEAVVSSDSGDGGKSNT